MKLAASNAARVHAMACLSIIDLVLATILSACHRVRSRQHLWCGAEAIAALLALGREPYDYKYLTDDCDDDDKLPPTRTVDVARSARAAAKDGTRIAKEKITLNGPIPSVHLPRIP